MVYYLAFMKTRHILLRVLLALSLLVSQQMAMAHLVSHLSGSHNESSGKQVAGDQYCDDCLSAAQLGSAATNTVIPILTDAGPAVAPSLHVAHLFLAGTACPFQSRAPPL
jgi:hypothetical protein